MQTEISNAAVFADCSAQAATDAAILKYRVILTGGWWAYRCDINPTRLRWRRRGHARRQDAATSQEGDALQQK